MRIELIPQIEIGGTHRLRVGDVLNRAIADHNHSDFRFAVAYARISGLNRLAVSIESLLSRGGHVGGAIGIDDEITSVELLEGLAQISADSTVFHSVSDFIFHPKLYVVNGQSKRWWLLAAPTSHVMDSSETSKLPLPYTWILKWRTISRYSDDTTRSYTSC